jgi:S-formylglutathione hydrolase FrmB
MASVTTTSVAGPAPTCAAAAGITRLTVPSATLSAPVRVSVVAAAPVTDATSVVYLLHGASTDETQWTAIGLEAALDAVAATGQHGPFVVALPDLPIDGHGPEDGDAVVRDVLPAVEACLGGVRTASQRAIGGISRGGRLALRVAAEHPDLFAAVAGHSPALVGNETSALAQALASARLPVWLDVADGDALRGPTTELASALSVLGAPADLHVRPGRHDRAYWGAQVASYLDWYASHLGG